MIEINEKLSEDIGSIIVRRQRVILIGKIHGLMIYITGYIEEHADNHYIVVSQDTTSSVIFPKSMVISLKRVGKFNPRIYLGLNEA